MKKVIISLLINLIYRLNKKQIYTKHLDSTCQIKTLDGRFLTLHMPDGRIIPGQLDLNIDQPFKLKGLAIVKCTFMVKFENLIQK